MCVPFGLATSDVSADGYVVSLSVVGKDKNQKDVKIE